MYENFYIGGKKMEIERTQQLELKPTLRGNDVVLERNTADGKQETEMANSSKRYQDTMLKE